MNILINASNLGGTGGAAQVADSICRELYRFPQHNFKVVLSRSFSNTKERITHFTNVEVFGYSYPLRDWKSLLTKRNDYLDTLVINKKIDVVLTIFGPSKWVPNCKHVCGFAYAHIVLKDSPYFTEMPLKKWIKERLSATYMSYLFKRCSRVFYTENPLITELLKKKFKLNSIYTITNNYNQIFDTPQLWKPIQLLPFEGYRIFTAASMMPHKNLTIIADIAKILISKYPTVKFQFVLTINEEDFITLPAEIKDSFLFLGGLHISSIPSLYSQSDVVFQPSLLECFSASYPEAMKMEKPLVVPDLEFTRGLCAAAALYYSPLSANEAAEQLYRACNDNQLRDQIITRGREQLLKYDSAHQRIDKIINLIESLSNI